MSNDGLMKPLAFIDVDGVLNRTVSNSVARRRGYVTYRADPMGFPVKIILDFKDRGRLQRLAEHFELAWGTTWEDEANRIIRPRLMIPQKWLVAKNTGPSASKAPGIVELAGDRPFVWFDDEARNEDRAYLKRAPNICKIIDVANISLTAHNAHLDTGLTDAHVDQAIAWTENLKSVEHSHD